MQTLAQIGAKADQANTKLTALDAKAEKRTPISSLPFKITSSGSYYVTGNLTGVSGNNGITITASGAAIDLNGFGLYGIAGAKVGVLILGGAKGTAVYNGRLSGWPEGGILARDAAASLPAIGSRFSDLQLDSNGMKGLDSGYAAVVRDCVAMNNAETGFAIGRGSTVERCTATGHGGGHDEAKRQNVAFLGEVPLFTEIREGGDKGVPVAVSASDAPPGRAFIQIAESLNRILT